MKKICVIYWDQLSDSLSGIKKIKKSDVLFFAEVKELTSNIPHHKKKLVFLLSAMRHFANEKREQGFNIYYVKFDDPGNTHSMQSEVKRFLEKNKVEEIIVTEPSEYDTLEDVKTWQKNLNIETTILSDDRFIASKEEFKKWAENKKSLIMEYFYREMRRKTSLLMNNDKPEKDQWNFDKENRKSFKKGLEIPGPKQFSPDAVTKDVIQLVEKNFIKHFGDTNPFWFAVTKGQAEKAFDYFCLNALPYFGDYQDAMQENEPFLFHSIIALYINAGLLDPLYICKQVEKEYKAKRIQINAAEGFIRQIIGWREYIRGVYWLKMPNYRNSNFLNTKRKLPEFYWTAKTDMNCIQQVVSMTKKEAYSHHIQRLMITGNFALLSGLNAQEVHEWYLAVYADAYEWVEIPNTLGMALFADGGVLGTKPYIASGAYVNRMSNFCKSCKYNVKEKLTDDACPFNYLYWNFLSRHKDKFKNNRRMTLAYKNLENISEDDRKVIDKKSKDFLDNLS